MDILANFVRKLNALRTHWTRRRRRLDATWFLNTLYSSPRDNAAVGDFFRKSTSTMSMTAYFKHIVCRRKRQLGKNRFDKKSLMQSITPICTAWSWSLQLRVPTRRAAWRGNRGYFVFLKCDATYHSSSMTAPLGSCYFIDYIKFSCKPGSPVILFLPFKLRAAVLIIISYKRINSVQYQFTYGTL